MRQPTIDAVSLTELTGTEEFSPAIDPALVANDPGLNSEWDLLSTALTRYGIHVARPVDVPVGAIPWGRHLITRLLGSRSLRLQEAAVLLLATHPHLVPEAHAVVRDAGGLHPSGGLAQIRAAHRYVAASALRRGILTDTGDRGRTAALFGREILEDLNFITNEEAPDLGTLDEIAKREDGRYGYERASIAYCALTRLLIGAQTETRYGVPRLLGHPLTAEESAVIKTRSVHSRRFVLANDNLKARLDAEESALIETAYSVEKVADQLGWNVHLVITMLRHRQLVGHRIGNHWYVARFQIWSGQILAGWVEVGDAIPETETPSRAYWRLTRCHEKLGLIDGHLASGLDWLRAGRSAGETIAAMRAAEII